MRIGVLTSSRADFGIYLPLLKRLKKDSFFDLSIIAFGTHLSMFHGETIRQINDEGFEVKHTIASMLLTDSAESISTSIGLTTIKFADFWAQNEQNFDLVFCLGDRFEMFAAVSAGIPYNIPFAHIHGGETTLGAIDDVFRHSITLASKYHFVSTPTYAQKVAALIGSDANVYYTGALALENIKDIALLSVQEFEQKWKIDLSQPTVLTTFHPETVNTEVNMRNINELMDVITETTDLQFLITMPNADTTGNTIRKIMNEKLASLKNVFLVENLGSQSYFTAMKYCVFLMGNTSSGIIEAASFQKYVINLGDRQKGRACSENILHSGLKKGDIKKLIEELRKAGPYQGSNIYYKENPAQKIINTLKRIAVHEI